MGDHSEELTQKAAKQLGWEVTTGALGTCKMCTVAKAKQKNLPKTMKDKIVKGQIQIYIDIGTLKDPPICVQIK